MTEIVHITLGKPRPARDDDPLGRSWLGYDSNRSPADNWEANRGAWKLDPARVERCDLAVFSHRGKVVLVADVFRAEPVPDADGYQRRWLLVGSLVNEHPLLGRQQPVPRSYGNPVTYGIIA
jgi:hypothetical protein